MGTISTNARRHVTRLHILVVIRALLVAALVIGAGAFVAPAAKVNEGELLARNDIVRVLAEAVRHATIVQDHYVVAELPGADWSYPAGREDQALLHLIRLVFTVEAFRLLLESLDHVVANWGFYTRIVADQTGQTWITSCKYVYISDTEESPEVFLDCAEGPAPALSK